MKAIQSGYTFKIHDDGLIVHNSLPAQPYLCCFDENVGFYLKKYQDIKINEKVYGIHTKKVTKVLNSFKLFNRNLGVILSGDKGIGKSLFSKLLAIKAIEAGYPIIIVNDYTPGVADFLSSIEQEVLILFDEFDKVFTDSNGNSTPQTEMLTLFDGISQGKKLFVITCNSIHTMNAYLINRPGRFHYHFRFDYPTDADIREYMEDKLSKEYYNEINKIISFSKKVSLNYDCLRSIAFEINTGLSFEEAITDLNIIRMNEEKYNVILTLDNGKKLKSTNRIVDLWSDAEECIVFRDQGTEIDIYSCFFVPSDNYFNEKTFNCVIDGKNIELVLDQYLEEEKDESLTKTLLYNKFKNAKPVSLTFHHTKPKTIHYFTV